MRPWALITYMFCHADLSQNPFHIVFNMLWLWYFGQFFLRRHTGRQLVVFYLTSGFVAGLFFVICYNIFPYFSLDRYRSYIVGASGAIFSLIAAVGITQADERIGLNLFVRVVWIRMWTLCAIVLALNFVSIEPGTNNGGVVCHVGGLLFGLLYGYLAKRGTDITSWPSHWWESICSWWTGLRRPKMTAMQGGRHETISADKKRDMDYNASQRQREVEIDRILDKISRSGYDGLTAEEKQTLFDASKRRKG